MAARRSKLSKAPKVAQAQEDQPPASLVSNVFAILAQLAAMWALSLAIMQGLKYMNIGQEEDAPVPEN